MNAPLQPALAGTLLVAGLAALSCSEAPRPPDPLAPIVRPEHPRPDFRRESFVNLNTVWEFAEDPDDVGLDEGWMRRADGFEERIQVPFAWEAPLSGRAEQPATYRFGETQRARTYRGVAWYRLRLPEPLPTATDRGWHLVFGAVDYEARVWINGSEVGSHEGGYAPFSVPVPRLEPDELLTIVVRVEDVSDRDDRSQPVGKQGGDWYTRTSGIWQTVYLEERPAAYLESLHVVPEPDEARVRVAVRLNTSGTVRLRATLDAEEVGAVSTTVTGREAELLLPLERVQRWAPGQPTLYELDVEVEGADGAIDLVHSYFGLVRVRTDWLPGHSPAETSDAGQQYRAVYVNDQPTYLRCVLDQSYFPDGVYTAPSEAALRADLELAQRLGFNCIRVHIKAEEPLLYRIADELGLLVVYDIPSLHMFAPNVPGFRGRDRFEANLRAVMERDRNHPSIIAWVVFNENWGLMETGSFLQPESLADSADVTAWVREMVDLTRTLDPTRPVEDNSAGGIVNVFDHVDTDLNSFHHYTDDASAFRELLEREAAATFPGSAANFVGGETQGGEPWLNSEFASFSLVGSAGRQTFCDLYPMLNELRRQPKLVGYVLTQLTDVEFETNGLVTYDRSPRDLCPEHGVGLEALLGDDFVGFEWLPEATVPAESELEVPLFISHWSSDSVETLTLGLRWGDGPTAAEATLDALPYEQNPLRVTLRAPVSGEAMLVAELRTADGSLRAANRLRLTVE